jgi:hypothetical protein
LLGVFIVLVVLKGRGPTHRRGTVLNQELHIVNACASTPAATFGGYRILPEPRPHLARDKIWSPLTPASAIGVAVSRTVVMLLMLLTYIVANVFCVLRGGALAASWSTAAMCAGLGGRSSAMFVMESRNLCLANWQAPDAAVRMNP